MITLRYSSLDGVRRNRSFKTLSGAKRYALQQVGNFDGFGHCAISDDGIGKIEVLSGTTLQQLARSAPEPYVDEIEEQGRAFESIISRGLGRIRR